MKKTIFLIALAFLLVLLWTGSCKSPSSADQPNPVATSKGSNSNNSNSGTTGSMGFLQLIITDAPVTNVDHILITIEKIRVHQACETEDACFIPILETPIVGFLLNDEAQLEISPVPLPAGKYNQIRMSVSSGQLFLQTDTTKGYQLEVPSDEIKIHYQFEVPPEGTAKITLDFNLEESLHIVKKGNNDVYILRPVVNVVNFEQQGPGI